MDGVLEEIVVFREDVGVLGLDQVPRLEIDLVEELVVVVVVDWDVLLVVGGGLEVGGEFVLVDGVVWMEEEEDFLGEGLVPEFGGEGDDLVAEVFFEGLVDAVIDPEEAGHEVFEEFVLEHLVEVVFVFAVGGGEVEDVAPGVVPAADGRLLQLGLELGVGGSEAAEAHADGGFDDGLGLAHQQDLQVFAFARSELPARDDELAAVAVSDEDAGLHGPEEELAVDALVDEDGG